MAIIYYPDGKQELKKPKDKVFNADELNEIVGGNFDAIKVPYINADGHKYIGWMFVNDNGKLIGLPLNLQATEIIRTIGYEDYIVGTAILCLKGEVN